jgi:hypothetical protein
MQQLFASKLSSTFIALPLMKFAQFHNQIMKLNYLLNHIIKLTCIDGSSNLTSLWVRDRVKLDSLPLELLDSEEGAGGEDENMAILALTLLAIFWGVLFLPTLHEFFNFSLLRSRLPVELADDLRLKISEFWKRNGKNIEKNLLYDNDMMRMIFFLMILSFIKVILEGTFLFPKIIVYPRGRLAQFFLKMPS